MVIPGLRLRALARSLVLCAALAAVAGLAETAQAQALPQDVAQAIEEAIRVSDQAATNAAFSADIANNGRPTGIADRTRQFIARSALAEAVVEGIARHPQATAAIVAAAVTAAPDHAQAIVHRASVAFPRFAPVIFAAAGMPPPVRQPLSSLSYLTSPTGYAAYGAAPYAQPLYRQPTYAPPPVYAQPTYAPPPTYPPPPAPVFQTVQAVPPQPSTALPRASTPSRMWPDFSLSEVRFGIVHHDTGVFGRNKEDGFDITLGMRFQPLTGDIWDYLNNPRPFISANINSSDETHALDFGVNWDWDFWRQSFFSFAFGGAAHTGKLQTSRLDRKELGSRVLFYLATELGYRITPKHSVSLRLDHMSNASLADNNEGLDTVGLIYGYHF